MNTEYILYITEWFSAFPAQGVEEAQSLWLYWFLEQ